MAEFTHLHLHTDYSLLQAGGRIDDYVARAAELGMTSLAISDYGNMFGVLLFYEACRKRDIKPIIGTEVYLADGSRHDRSSTDRRGRYPRIVLLARNTQGYRNLLQISSCSYTEGFYYKPRVDNELLSEYHEGIMALSGSLQGDIPAMLLQNRHEAARERAVWYRDTFGPGNFYLEVQDHGAPEERIVNEQLVELSRELDIPLVAANDCHYVRQEDANAHDILLCIGSGKTRQDTNRPRMFNAEFYLKSSAEMSELFRHIPDDARTEALENTNRIAADCSVEIAQPGPLLPIYSIPPDFSSAADYLRHLTFAGLSKRYGDPGEDITSRANFELDTIIGMDYTGYFLIVWDFIRYAKDNDIPVGPGRGSGAGSIVAYALEITDVDPIEYGLLFERFLNPDRVSMPDFDIDFCYERRGEVISYVTEKYGSDRVGQIITFGTLKAKAAIRDTARALDIPLSEADRIAKLIPDGPKVSLQGAIQQEADLKKIWDQGGVYAELLRTSLKLEGLHRHASTHAAGIVIGKTALTDYVPLYRDPRTGSISTQFTMDQIEPCGLVKMDFLGLKTLTLIRNTENLIRRHDSDFDIERVADHDEKTYELLGAGRSACIFQFESPGMQDILTRAKPGSISDLTALNALYRPGPMENIPQFVDSKSGRKPIRFPHEKLRDILTETYGVIVYQEQVMEIVRIIAGFSLGQADILRRAMGKKKVKEMEQMKVSFLDGARERGISKEKAAELFNLLEPFAGYGFNKSHAAAYSVLAYKTAYLKANYPAEFMAANLTNEINSPDKFAEYLAEARSMGLSVDPPDINLSDRVFTVVDGHIRFGLLGIKNVGGGAVDAILQERAEHGPFLDILDLLTRVDMRTVNRKVIETLMYAGAFDSLDPRRATLIANLPRMIDYAASDRAARESGQTSLFDDADATSGNGFEMVETEAWSAAERLGYERDLIGFYSSGHPLDDHRETWERCRTLNIADVQDADVDSEQVVVGLITAYRSIISRRGSPMAFGVIEDYTGSCEFVAFEESLSRVSGVVDVNRVVGLTGVVQRRRRGNDPKSTHRQLALSLARAPEDLHEREISNIHIQLTAEADSEDRLCELRSLMVNSNGPCPVFLHVSMPDGSNGHVIRAGDQLTIAAKATTLEGIRNLPFVADVWQENRSTIHE